MEKFATLYEVNGIGQILVLKTQDEDGSPVVKIDFCLAEGIRTAVSFSYDDDEAGYALQDKCFDSVSEEFCINIVNRTMKDLGFSK